MAQATDMPRNETGIDTALGILKQQFGERFQTGGRDPRTARAYDDLDQKSGPRCSGFCPLDR